MATYSRLDGIKSAFAVGMEIVDPIVNSMTAPSQIPSLNCLVASEPQTGLCFPIGPLPYLRFATEMPNGPQFPTTAIQSASSLTTFEPEALKAAFPIKLASTDLTESMLVPLVNQFGLMQQQMFDQFQQAMTMMVQMFGTMHRDQMVVIREELDRLHALTEEFHALKNELTNRTKDGGQTMSEESAVAPATVNSNWSAATEPNLSAKMMASERSTSRKATHEEGDATSALQGSPSIASWPEQRLSPDPPLSSPLKQPAKPSVSEKLQESSLCAQDNGTSIRADSEQDSIAWLHQRIMTLQHERETRWQKILKLLPGAS